MTAMLKRYFITDRETGERVLDAIRDRFDGDKRLFCRFLFRQSFGDTPTDHVKEDVGYFLYACPSPIAGDRGAVYLYSLVHDTGEAGVYLFTVLIDLPRPEDQPFVEELVGFLDSFEFVPFHGALRPRPCGPAYCPGYLDEPIDTSAFSQWLRSRMQPVLASAA